MTLEEIVQQLKDAQTVTGAQTLHHEARLKEHHQWLEDNELAYAKHREMMADLDIKITQIAAAQLLSEEATRELKAAQTATEAALKAFIDSLRKAGNGHN